MKLLATFVTVLPLAFSLYIAEGARDLSAASPKHRCKMVGGADVNCHYCDRLDCKVVTVLQDKQTYNFDCLCPDGESINGISAWDHNPDKYCWVWSNTTDQNCPTTGRNALPMCDFCSK
ncbi:hypothetical protein EG329_003184 [Mollisiaceae sp. DMI_Dod_QoI]|nr:hypothetical protein EG329_003184 [Helotiales sp. DMI_Dod_QoI]